MKGMVFTEFFELVDDKFSPEIAERLIDISDLESGGAYTSVGTYDAREMVTLVSGLSALTGVPVPDLLVEFGRWLFAYFLETYPAFFEGTESTMEFLPRVESFVHLEVKKLYPDAELPSFTCVADESGTMCMTYRSMRDLPDLAEGLILACIDHFEEPLVLTRETDDGESPGTRFVITPE